MVLVHSGTNLMSDPVGPLDQCLLLIHCVDQYNVTEPFGRSDQYGSKRKLEYWDQQQDCR